MVLDSVVDRKIVFLDAGTLYGEGEIERLATLGGLHIYNHSSAEETVERMRGAEVVITNKVYLGKEEMKGCPSLKLICVAATGTNNIDLEAAKEMNISVKNVKDYSTPSVVQITFSMLAHLSAPLAPLHEFVASGSYQAHPYFTHLPKAFDEWSGKKWGIVGMGNIGRGVAAVAQAMGFEVIYHSLSGSIQSAYNHVDKPTLFRESDVLSLHCPLNERSRNFVNADTLRLMKPEAILINVARGGIVDELALVEALKAGRLAGAALDVYDTEPMSKDSPLLTSLPSSKLLLTPHIAWGSKQARQRLVQGIFVNIQQHFA